MDIPAFANASTSQNLTWVPNAVSGSDRIVESFFYRHGQAARAKHRCLPP